jgi:hypothetical protein
MIHVFLYRYKNVSILNSIRWLMYVQCTDHDLFYGWGGVRLFYKNKYIYNKSKVSCLLYNLNVFYSEKYWKWLDSNSLPGNHTWYMYSYIDICINGFVIHLIKGLFLCRTKHDIRDPRICLQWKVEQMYIKSNRE